MKKILMIGVLVVLGLGACGDDEKDSAADKAAEKIGDTADAKAESGDSGKAEEAKTSFGAGGDVEKYCKMKKKLDEAADSLDETKTDEEAIAQMQKFVKDHGSDIADFVKAAPDAVRPKIQAIIKGLENPEDPEAQAAIDDPLVAALDEQCIVTK